VWQQFIDERTDPSKFAFLSVAVDVDPERPKTYAAPFSFPTVVDSAGMLGRMYDFDVVPNCLFLDEAGVIRFVHIGGFEVQRPEIVQQVEALLQADFSSGEQPLLVTQEPLEVELLRAELTYAPDDAALHFDLGQALMQEQRLGDAAVSFQRAAELDPSDWSGAFALGTVLYQQGRKEEALSWWKEALRRDPANFTVHKQIWWVEHPEKFYPAIDADWQREQLRIEGYRR
jgi:tetratricopeptide (TPR) repeat protein